MSDIEIYKKINSECSVSEGYTFIKIDDLYWGIDEEGFFTYGIESNNKSERFIQNTKFLKLQLNVLCDIVYAQNVEEKKLSILTIKTKDETKVLMFIRVIRSFSLDKNNDNFLKYFLYLKELFSNDYRMSDIELQGLYGELFSIIYFKRKYNYDLSVDYQKSDKMKFDFSLDEDKKIDAKTTTKSERVHHFLQEQLNVLRYDVKIISIMLQKDDKGLSLYDLIEECKRDFAYNFTLIFHIEMSVKNVDQDKLKDIKYNYKYTEDNIKVFDSKDIPRIMEKNKDGVFNVEFDSNLSNIKELSYKEVSEWLDKND